MTETQGYGSAQHLADRTFRPGGLVQVMTGLSARNGELAMVTEIRSAVYSVVTIHLDGQQRVWRPDELQPVAPDEKLLAELDRLERIVRKAGEGIDLRARCCRSGSRYGCSSLAGRKWRVI